MKLEQMPRYPLLCGFTPLQRMENLEQALGCGPLYIKRDDLTPLGLGGNKTRKLEFLLGDALAGGADTLVTVGGVQTNHGRLTAAAAAKAGLACTLVLDGARPEKLSGNLLLDCLLERLERELDEQSEHSRESHRRLWDHKDGRSTSAVIEETLAALQAAGRAPYFIPEGGSNAVGSAGYLAMVPELLAQADSLPVPPARLVCTMGSLGTFAGLWLGARAFGAPFSVTGVAVNPTTGYTREKAAALVNEMSAAYGLDIAAAPEDMDIIYADAAHDYAGPGYNVPDAKTRGAVELLARTEGIFLDPCYTAKSFRGFCDIARELDGGAIFVHTGGTPALWTQEHLDAFAADYWN